MPPSVTAGAYQPYARQDLTLALNQAQVFPLSQTGKVIRPVGID